MRACVLTSCLVEVSTAYQHPKWNLIQKCMICFNCRLCTKYVVDILESYCSLPPASSKKHRGKKYLEKWLNGRHNYSSLWLMVDMGLFPVYDGDRDQQCIWCLAAFPSSTHCFIMCNYESDLTPPPRSVFQVPKRPLHFDHYQAFYLPQTYSEHIWRLG